MCLRGARELSASCIEGLMACGTPKTVRVRVGKRTQRLRACVSSAAITAVTPAVAKRLGIGKGGGIATIELPGTSCVRKQHVAVSKATYESDIVVGRDFWRPLGAFMAFGRGCTTILCGTEAREAARKTRGLRWTRTT